MPYASIDQLPAQVKDNLPQSAQRIYRAAFNDAWDRYADPSDRRGDVGREETAHKVAWSAVKERFEKEDGEWVRQNT